MGKAKPFIFILTPCLLLALCACNRQQSAAPPPEESAAVYDVPGEDAADVPSEPLAPVETPAPATDGLEGSYYNDFLRLTLTLDGEGGCTLSGGGTGDVGTYAAGEDGALTLSFPTGQETAVIDADGDLTVGGRTGYFLRDWSYWGITAAETGTEPVPLPYDAGNVTVLDNRDGTFRYRDPDNALAFTYPAGMTAQSGRLIGGVVAEDGSGGAVAGRNVTALYSTHKGTDDEFLADYVHAFVFTDFGILYGGVRAYQPLTLLHEGIEGRLAAATMVLSGGTEEAPVSVSAKIILYTSTYADGTVNYICKTVFSPDAARIDELSDAVTDMGAMRIR